MTWLRRFAAPEIPPQLETQRLVLRRYAFGDADRIAVLLTDTEIAMNLFNIPVKVTVNYASEWIQRAHRSAASGTQYKWALVRRTDDLIMGEAGIHFDQYNRRGSLGYWLGRAYRGQGYTTEAVLKVIEYAFEQHHLDRLYAECFSVNIESARVMQRVGMQHEGTLRQHYYHALRDEMMDAEFYGLLRSEYEQWKR